MPTEVYNPNPTIFKPTQASRPALSDKLWIDEDDAEQPELEDDDTVEPIDRDEIFELIRYIRDPEHPNTLEELAVVSAPQITVKENNVTVEFTPTIPHCGMSSFIGLSIRYRLLCSLPPRFKVDIRIKPGSHVSEASLTKQINDKERVAAALEAPAILRNLQDLLKDIN